MIDVLKLYSHKLQNHFDRPFFNNSVFMTTKSNIDNRLDIL